VQWVIRNKAGLNIITKPCGEWNHHMTGIPLITEYEGYLARQISAENEGSL